MRTATAVALLSLLGAPADAQQKAAAPKTIEPGWSFEPFSARNKAADFEVTLTGYVQYDFRQYEDWSYADEDGVSLLPEESDWRRLRLGLEGRYKKLRFEVDAAAAFDAGDELKDAWLGLRLAREFELRVGNMKLPGSPEWLTSNAKTDFVERAVPVEALSPSRDVGVQALGEVGRWLEYQAGVFVGDGRTADERADTTYAGRLVLKPSSWLDVGGYYSQADVEAEAAGPGLDPLPKGLLGESFSGYDFHDRLFVQGTRRRWGADLRGRSGPVSVRAEYLQENEQRLGQGPTFEDLPDVRGRGWQVATTWLVTGERKTGTVRPERRLFRGAGAVELAARYEELRVDDVENEGFEGFGNRARNVREAGYRAFVGGVSWWPTIFLRFLGDVSVERYMDGLRAPESGRTGDYVTLFARVQVHLP
jgi:phosphate-selective porin